MLTIVAIFLLATALAYKIDADSEAHSVVPYFFVLCFTVSFKTNLQLQMLTIHSGHLFLRWRTHSLCLLSRTYFAHSTPQLAANLSQEVYPLTNREVGMSFAVRDLPPPLPSASTNTPRYSGTS